MMHLGGYDSVIGHIQGDNLASLLFNAVADHASVLVDTCHEQIYHLLVNIHAMHPATWRVSYHGLAQLGCVGRKTSLWSWCHPATRTLQQQS